jgi:aminoglycoside/choline kinase family phosphotransferase
MFRENSILTDGAVVGVQIDIIGQDRGFTGVIVRVRLQYSGHQENAPSSVVVKIPTAIRDTPSAYRTSQEKEVTAARRYFERCVREVAFYQQIAPLSALPVPRLYYGATDEETGRVILVLEDLHSVRLGDALGGCSTSEAALVVEQLAHFHAQWWNHPPLSTFPWLPLWGRDTHIAQKRYVECIDPFLRRFGSRVPRRIRGVIDALATSYGAVRERLKLAPTTMIHADLHLDNLLFSPPEEESGVILLDWQSVARGRGALDLGLFLFGSLDTPTRRAVEGDLFWRYHDLLVAGGVTGYDFSQLVEDCQWVLLWLLGAKVVWLGSIEMESLSGRELALVDGSLTEESFAALLDHDAGSLLPL